MAPGEIVAFVVAAVAATPLVHMLHADARDWRRMRERMRHQRALAELKPWGDVVELPAAARNDAGEGRKIRSDRLAQGMSLTHSEGANR